MSISRKQKSFNATSRSSAAGFTIIEVMIILVIAAAIVLLVFLAVPVLQRNSRNNQRKSDAARVLTATTEWRVNNANKFPDCRDMANIDERLAGIKPACHDGSREAIEQIAGKLGHYEAIWSISDIAITPVMTVDNSFSDPNVLSVVGDSVFIRTNSKCAEPNKLEVASGAMVVVYSQETSNGMILACRG